MVTRKIHLRRRRKCSEKVKPFCLEEEGGDVDERGTKLQTEEGKEIHCQYKRIKSHHTQGNRPSPHPSAQCREGGLRGPSCKKINAFVLV